MPQANTDRVIEAVHVVSTGSGEQHREHRYGSGLPQLWWLLTSRSWIKLPINAFVIFAPSDDPLFAPFYGTYDVMGDGSMILLPTPGHTPGSMSLLLRSEALPPLLPIEDLTYQADLLMKDQVPGTGDAAQLCASFTKVRALKKQFPDLVILLAHDPAAVEALAASQALQP